MGATRWSASSQCALWVGLRAEEEFTFCSVHLPSWVSDDCFEQSVEEFLEAGRSKASGSIFLGSMPTAILTTVTTSGVSWSRNCALSITYNRCSNAFATLVWQPPAEGMWKKKLDFFFTNQTSAGVEIAFERKKKSLAGWSPQTSSQHHERQSALSKQVSLGSSMTDVEQRFDDARSRL